MEEQFDYRTAPDPEMLGDASGPAPSRRGFLFWMGAAFNGIAAMLIGIPVVGYIISPWKQSGWQTWVTLKKVDQYRKGHTIIDEYVNPFKTPWDGYTANVPCWVRHDDRATSQSLRSTAPTLGARSVGSRNPIYSCVHAMAACITPMAAMPPDRHRVVFTSTKPGSRMDTWK